MRQRWNVVASAAIVAVGCGGHVITEEESDVGSGGSDVVGQGGTPSVVVRGSGGRSVGTGGHSLGTGGRVAGTGGHTVVTNGSGGVMLGSGGKASAGGAIATGGRSSGGTATGAGGAATLPDSETLTMAPFTVDPGGEVYFCQNFANPFHATVEIGSFESHMTVGSHHMLMNAGDGITDGPLSSCSGLTPPSGPYVSQQPDETLSYPSGVASALGASSGYMVQVHYLNSGTAAVVPKVVATLHRAKGAVTAQARLLSVIAFDIQVPPNGTGSAGSSFAPGEAVQLFQLVGHMHRHGVHFQAKLGSEVLYDVDSWEAPPKTFSPARPLAASDQIDFTCSFKNDTATALTFGESAATNEMCLLLGQYY